MKIRTLLVLASLLVTALFVWAFYAHIIVFVTLIALLFIAFFLGWSLITNKADVLSHVLCMLMIFCASASLGICLIKLFPEAFSIYSKNVKVVPLFITGLAGADYLIGVYLAERVKVASQKA